MQTIRTTLKLTTAQARRLRELAEQCGLTPDEMASTIAILALNQHVGEPLDSVAPRPAQAADSTVPDRGPAKVVSCTLPDTGFLRLNEIVGRPSKGDKPALPRLIPVSRSTWLAGVKSGAYPQPVNLGGRVTAWRVEDIRKLIQRFGA